MMRHNAPRGQMMPPEIHELELELQLLKRKRQLLQQQQDLLIGGGHQNNRQRQRDYNYDQSSQMYNQQQQPQDFDFSHLYDDRVTGSGNRGRQFGQKRQAVDPWESNAPPKRFHGSRGNPKNVAGPRSNQGFVTKRGGSNFRQRSDRPQPLRNVDARPNSGNRNAAMHTNSSLKGVRKDFQPSKVTKPKAVSAPNKLDYYPRSERKRLIGKALTADDESFILSADKPATPTQSGRMELALGNILKDLRQDFSTQDKYMELFQSERLLKVVKQTLRDRIRSVMIGQPVISMKTIIDTYREKYPRENDQEIVNTVMDVAFVTKHENKLAIRLVESEVPETYFRVNMGKLLDVKLDEMFKKLQTLYADENENIQDIIDDQIPADPNTDTNALGVGEDKYDPVAAFQNTDSANESANDSVDKINTSTKDNVINEDNSSAIGEADPSVSDAVPSNENVETVTENDEPSLADAAPLTDDATPSADDDKDVDKNDENSSKPQDKIEKEEIRESDAIFLKAWKSYNSKYFTADFFDRLINKSLYYKLPRLLPKYKDNILKILETDKQYKTTKATIVNKQFKNKTDKGNQPINYYVKIFGRPGLPKRKLMSKFLDDYNPLTIKKHKTVHNLLFVGFHHKEDFDKILTATGTRIGSVTLTIAVSDWKNISKTSVDKEDSTEVGAESANDKGEKEEKPLINEDLDCQITDLLTSINKEDIKSDEHLEETNKKIEDAQVVENKEAESEQATKTETKNGVQVVVEKSDGNNSAENQNKTANDDQVEGIKTDAKKTAAATPTRSSTRLATSTPSGISTRRTSKLP